MATGIPNVTDYIPALQPFKPNLNFYGSVLQQRQSRYDQGLKQLNSLYGSMLYAPLSRDKNIERRDEFFETIDNDLKKITSMDLSLPQNVQAAASIFDPLVTDKYIAHDMVYTRRGMNSLQEGESYRGCTDRKKCGGLFWQEGLDYIKLKMQDYNEASPEEALEMQAPRYHPYINVIDEAFQWAKDQGLVVDSIGHDKSGRYLVTRQNGMQLMLPLKEIYKAMYGKDPMVRDMYNTSAYLRRKQYVNNILPKFNGDVKQAEEEYFTHVMNTTAKALSKQAEEASESVNDVKGKKTTLEQIIANKGMNIKKYKDDPIFKKYAALANQEEIADSVQQYYSEIKSEIDTFKNNGGNRQALQSRVDSIVANGLLELDMNQAATLFAYSHNAITDIKADPYSLANHKFAQDIQKLQYTTAMNLKQAVMVKAIEMMPELFNNFMHLGTDAQNGKQLSPGNGGVTGIVDAESSLTYMQNQSTKGITGAKGFVSGYLDSVTNQLQRAASENPYLKKELERIYGKDLYDSKTNQFKIGTSMNPQWRKLNIDTNKLMQIYANARELMKVNPEYNLLNGRDITSELMEYEHQANVNALLVKAAEDNMQININKISQGLHLDTNLSEAQKIHMEYLFKDNGGQKSIRTKDEFVKVMLPYFKGGSTSKRRKAADAAYNAAWDRYNSYYNPASPIFKGLKLNEVRGLMPGMELSAGGKGWQANRMLMDFDASAGMSSAGNQTALSILDKTVNGEINPVILAGSDHYRDASDDNRDFDKQSKLQADNQNTYKALLTTLFNDMSRSNSMFVTKGDQKSRPKGTIIVQPVAANDPNTIAYTFMPDQKWLDTTGLSTKEGTKYVMDDLLRQDILANGLTMYVPKTDINGQPIGDYFTESIKQNPFDIILSSGNEQLFEVPDGGYIKAQRDGNIFTLSGAVTEYIQVDDGKGNLEWKKGPSRPLPQLYQDLSGDPTYSPGILLDKAYKSLTAQALINAQKRNDLDPSITSYDLRQMLEQGDPVETMMMQATQNAQMMMNAAQQFTNSFLGNVGQ